MKNPSQKSGIRSLLKKNISRAQLAGYFVANIIGLTVILAGVLFFCDTRRHQNETDSFFSDDYIVVSKKVKGVNMEPVAFSKDEISEIEALPWAKEMGVFTPSLFSVAGSIDMGGRGISTYMFLESVPDEFFDKMPSEWSFSPEKRFVPIVLNKDYLALYNFGFALPQGMPQMSEEVIGSVPLKLKLIGSDGHSEIFDAAVVGFSSRLNTIAVPQEFMDWANNRFAPQKEPRVSRLIIKIDRLDSKGMEEYLAGHNYEISGDEESSSRLSDFMGIVSAVVAAIGLLISLLAIFILILSIYLILQKSKTMIRHLLLLGYSPRSIAKYYEGLVLISNSLITLIAIGATFLVRLIWLHSVEALGLRLGNVIPMIATALIFLVITTSFNFMVINRQMLKIWNNK